MEMTGGAGFWVAVALCVLPLLWWWNECWYVLPFHLRRGSGGAKLPPGYMGLPFVGDMAAFIWYFKILRRPDEFVNSKRRKYGDGVGLYRTHLLGTPIIMACDASANKLVLQSESGKFGVGWYAGDLIGTTSLGAIEGPEHTRVRGLVLRAVNQPDALRKVALTVQPRLIASLKSWSHMGRITLLKEANKLIFATTGKCFASIETGHVLDTLDDLFMGLLSGLRAYPINFPGTTHHYAIQCRKKAMAIFRKELEKRKKCEGAGGSEAKYDLMEELMELKDEEGNSLSEIEVLDNIVNLVVAGYSTTSLAVMWALYYLAKYPHVLQNLLEEHMEIRKKLKGELITYEEIASCKYTSKVVEEILRMSNLVAFVYRTAKEDVEYKGYKIPKGWTVACWLRYGHTNPDYFEDPMRFNPDRWNEQAKAGSYLVFGAGPRMCAGNMFARLQLALLLHHLVLGYRWKLVNPDAEIIYLPHPRPADEVEIDITQI